MLNIIEKIHPDASLIPIQDKEVFIAQRRMWNLSNVSGIYLFSFFLILFLIIY